MVSAENRHTQNDVLPTSWEGKITALTNGRDHRGPRSGESASTPSPPSIDGLRDALSDGFAFGVATHFAVLSGLAPILLAVDAYLSSKIQM
jgi:hypothetical protein